MPIKTMSSREFNQNTAAAKRAAKKGPVYITDRGRPVFTLLSFEDYGKLTGKKINLLESLYSPEAAEIEFEYPTHGPTIATGGV